MNPPVVLITGALTGIGRATALAFAQEGARIVVAMYWSRSMGKATHIAMTAANAHCTINGVRSAGASANRIAIAHTGAASANRMPPTHVELSKPAATTSARASTLSTPASRVMRLIKTTARTTQAAAATCCGAQLA